MSDRVPWGRLACVIVPLHAHNPGPLTGSGNWTYLVSGAASVLVDAGVGDPRHLDEVAERVPEGPGQVIVTHAHDDHASGVTALAARWPRTRFSKLPWPARDARYAVSWEWLADGQVVPAGDDSLRIVHTPGHAPDHLCLWHAPSRTLFSGDLAVLGTTVVIPASHGGSLAAYLASLERVLALHPSRLLPAHGPVIEDPETVIRAYLDHRRQREEQILAALAASIGEVDAIVTRMYVGLDPAVVPMARESVRAHLVKLEDDGVVRRDGEVWRLSS